MNIFENRRKWLEFWIATKAGGSRAAFGRLFGYSKAQLTQYLSETYREGRAIGDNAARKIEQAVGATDRIMDADFEESLKNSSSHPSRDTSPINIINTVNASQLSLIHVNDHELRLLTQYRQADEMGRSLIESAAESAPKVPNLFRSVKK